MSLFCSKSRSAWIFIFAVSLFPDFLIAQEGLTSVMGSHQEAISHAYTEVSLEGMTLDEKVGQLLMIGFPQMKLDSQLQKHLLKYKISSFIFFKRNIVNLSQVAQFNLALRTFTKQRLNTDSLIAVDQEGGLVARLQTQPRIPNAYSVGLTKNPELANDLGVETGQILRQYGFNMNLAPVLDLSDVKVPTFIGLRSFGFNPDVVSQMSSRYASGLLSSGVLPTAKHFPGMTLISQDPHQGSIASMRTADEIRGVDLLPYQRFVELGPNTAIMLSHLAYPSLDATKTPAIFSHKIAHDVLRNDLKFEGLVITDDIQMKSSIEIAKPWVNAIRSLKAGADIIIFSWSFHDQEMAFNEIKKAISSGDLPMELVDTKVKRILAVKKFYSLQTIRPILSEATVHLSAKLAEIDAKITSHHALSISSQIKNLDPDKNLCVYSSNQHFISAFKQESLKKIKFYQFGAKTKPSTLSRHMERNSCLLNFITVYGKLSANMLAQAKTAAVTNKTFVINFSHSSVVSSFWPKSQSFEFGFPHFGAGRIIAQMIKRTRHQRYLSNLSDESSTEFRKGASDEPDLNPLERAPNPFERYPSGHRLRTQ